jgi:SAM-dependent methyltransferase
VAAQCVVCGGRIDPWCRKLERDVFRCSMCGHIMVPAGLVRDASGTSIYEQDDTIFSADGNADYYFDETNADAAREKLAFVTRYAKPHGRLLDVGASFGHFLAEARTGFEASGVEVSPSAVAWARKTFDVDIEVGSIYELGRGRYDAITCWDVIEHLEDPAGAIDQLRAHLNDGGRLFLSTPDAASFAARLLGSRWYYLDPVQHLNLFSRTNLLRMLSERRFRLVGYRYFGRSYRVNYIANRLRYLAFGGSNGHATPMRVPFGQLTIPIKLWDVMGLALEARA